MAGSVMAFVAPNDWLDDDLSSSIPKQMMNQQY